MQNTQSTASVRNENKQPKILVVGSFVVDQVMKTDTFPAEGQSVIGKGFTKAPGGKGANQAVQMARLGASVTMVGKLGRDANGKEMLAACSAAGLDVSHVAFDEIAPTGCAVIVLQEIDGAMQNRIIVYPGANMTITPEDVAFLEEEIANYDLVVLQLEIPMAINELVAKYAHNKGVPVFLNTAPWEPISDDFLSCLTYVCPNETEAEGLTGIHIPREGRTADLGAAKCAAEKLIGRGAKNVLITLGAAGAAMFGEVGEQYSPSAKGITAVDPTAAGDSFIGGFCYSVCSGKSIEEAMRFANHTAALTVSRMGAIPSLPTLKEVETLLASAADAKNTDEPTAPPQAVEKGIEHTCRAAYDRFLAVASTETKKQIEKIDYASVVAAAKMIRAAEKTGGRIHISGIGKCSYVTGYMASLMSSTGTPTYFLHGTESVHGSCGQLRKNDIVIFISNSGETQEMKASVLAIRNNGCRVIGVSGSAESWLAKTSDLHLLAKVDEEGGPMNRAPRMSIFAETFVLQALSVVLQEDFGVTPAQYVKWHPGGKLGNLRPEEK